MRAWRTGVRAWLPTKTCEFDSHCPHQADLRLAAQDARLSSEVTRVQIPQVGPFQLRIPPSSNGRMSHFECDDRGSNPPADKDRGSNTRFTTLKPDGSFRVSGEWHVRAVVAPGQGATGLRLGIISHPPEQKL